MILREDARNNAWKSSQLPSFFVFFQKLYGKERPFDFQRGVKRGEMEAARQFVKPPGEGEKSVRPVVAPAPTMDGRTGTLVVS